MLSGFVIKPLLSPLVETVYVGENRIYNMGETTHIEDGEVVEIARMIDNILRHSGDFVAREGNRLVPVPKR